METIEKLDNKAQLYGISAVVTPFSRFNSSSRATMAHNQGAQALPPKNPVMSRILGGYEDQTAKHTFKIVAPCDMEVIKVIRKYHATPGQRSLGIRPPEVLLFQNTETGVYDYLQIENYVKNAEYFGLKYEIKSFVSKIVEGSTFPKGTVFAEPTTIVDGLYNCSIPVPLCYLTTGGTIEDGIEMSETMMDNFSPVVVGSRVVKWGKHRYPINLYGNENRYKPYQEPGEKIRDDGLLVALRDYDEIMDCVNMLSENLMSVDMASDSLTYAEGGATVHDVDVLTTVHDNAKNGKKTIFTPEGMAESTNFYHNQKDRFNKLLISEVERLPNYNNGKALSPALQTLVTEALADRPSEVRIASKEDVHMGQIIRTMNGVPLDEYHVEIKYHNQFMLGLGAKFAAAHGSKGVIVRVRPDRFMPIDKFGNQAHVVVHGTSVISRLIGGQLYEQYINAASRDVSKDIRKMMDNGDNVGAWKHLVGYYEVASPTMFAAVDTVYGKQREKDEHLQEVYDDGIRLVILIDDPDLGVSLYQKIKAYREPDRSPVKLHHYDCSSYEWSKSDVLIGEVNFSVLEKSATKPSAECTARLQNNGLPASTSKLNKYARPTTRAANRSFGEGEVRALGAAGEAGGLLPAELMELATCPEVTKLAVEELFTAKDPMNIPYLVDRRVVPLGGSRSSSFFNHLLSCSGAVVTAQRPEEITER